MLNNFPKFTVCLNKVLALAEASALSRVKKEIDLKDLLLSLVKTQGCLAKDILIKAGFKAREQNIKFLNQETSVDLMPKINFSKAVKRVLERSTLIAWEFGQNYIGTEHLLFAVFDVDHLEAQRILGTYGVDGKKVIEQLKIIFKSTKNFKVMTETVGQLSKIAFLTNDFMADNLIRELVEDMEGFSPGSSGLTEKDNEKKRNVGKIQKESVLEFFSRELTDKNLQKNIDPVIGREDEIQRLIQILSRRTKNNPVLLGDPGVGKTAIVEGLAKKILLGVVPDFLLDRKIYALDLGLLVAGTMMRGEFEARLKQILAEIKNRPEVILFIDELHNIVGAGAPGGSMDAANILKPALARGELRCIGATTFSEYKKYVEEDAALERRFQAIKIEEPSIEDAIKILNGIKENYEKHHLIEITEEAIEAAVKLSERYLPEKFLPDKAIDLIDEASAGARIKAGAVNENLRQLNFLKSKIEDLDKLKEDMIRQEKYEDALKIKNQINEIWNLISLLENKLEAESASVKYIGSIKASDIIRVIAKIIGMPEENLVMESGERVLDLEKVLAKKIVGQEQVLKEISFCLKRSQAGLKGRNSPLSSFMFLGPSGVGKTETAKVLAEEIFKGNSKKSALIHLDMSEFSESFNVSRLIGSPAGYIGYKEGGRLTEAVRRNPYSVVLFDEIEKAHSEVFNILLQILDEGILTDAAGKRVDFRNTIIVLTSNLGNKELEKGNLGFSGQEGKKAQNFSLPSRDQEDIIIRAVKEKFRPEFLGRLDKILVFKNLDLKAAEKIADLQLRELAERLKINKDIKLFFSQKAIKGLARLGFSKENGARNIQHVIEEQVEVNLAEKIINKEIKSDSEVNLEWDKNGLAIR